MNVFAYVCTCIIIMFKISLAIAIVILFKHDYNISSHADKSLCYKQVNNYTYAGA